MLKKESQEESVLDDVSMDEINKLYYVGDNNKYTEEYLLFYLFLHPSGFIEDADPVMKSPIAEKYFRMGYITKGLNGLLKQQYRLTSFGLKQIENAMVLSALSC